MHLECILHGRDVNLVAVRIPVKKSVATDRNLREDERTDRNVRLNRTARTYTENCQCPVLRLDLSGLEIDIGKRIKLGKDNVNVICSYTCGKNSNALSMILSGDGNELSGSMSEFLFLEEFAYHIDTARISYKDDLVRKFFWFQMNVEN